jgi:hypothetical protein
MSLKIKTLGELVHRTSVSIAATCATDEFKGSEFVQINGDYNAEKVGEGDTPTLLWQVFQDTYGRMDRLGTGKLTAVYGIYFADIDLYDVSSGSFANGMDLTVKYCTTTDYNGTEATGCFVSPATSGDLVVAKCMCPPNSSPRGDGWMRIQTVSQYTYA